MTLPVAPPVKPMLAKAVNGFAALPAGEYRFEPKWDGFRAIVFRDGDEVTLGSRNERPLTRYFPELLPPLRAMLPNRCVVDGEIVVITDEALDFDALQQRIHPAESRVNLLAQQTPASFIAFDLLALGDRDLRAEPMVARRELLAGALAGATPPLHLTPQTADLDQARRWFDDFEGAGLDGLIAKPVSGAYVEDRRVQFKLKHKRTADCVVAGFRWYTEGGGQKKRAQPAADGSVPGVGSLLLGLWGDDGRLHHLGVAASFSAARRAELADLLAPLTEGALEQHPWRDWVTAEAHESARLPGAVSRWNNQKDLSWVPIRLELVAEVEYAMVTNGRFRGVTYLVRWRPDRTVASCRFDQLAQPEPLTVREVLRS